jgi:hypothetical protein
MHDNASQEAAASEPSREEPREGEWLSYAELGRIRGIGRESAKKLALREGWRRIPGNDGSTRVLVPREWLKRAREPSREHTRESSREDTRAISVLEAAFSTALAAKEGEIAALRAMIEVKGSEIAGLREQADRAETRADRAEAALTAERSRVDELLADLTAAEAATERAGHEAQAAHADAAELRQAEEERKARGRWARLRAAWRGQ